MKRTWFLLLAAVFVLSACRSFREVPITRIDHEIERGDLVRVTRHDEQWILFRVTAIDEGTVVGEDVRIEIEDIRTIEKEGNHGLTALGESIEAVIAILTVSAAVAVAF